MKNFLKDSWRPIMVAGVLVAAGCSEESLMDPTTTTSLVPTAETVATTTTLTPETVPSATVAIGNVCVIEVVANDTISGIISQHPDAGLTVRAILDENNLEKPENLPTGPLDICVGNGIYDVTGETIIPPTTTIPPETTVPPTVPPETAVAPPQLPTGVVAQQQKLNELFANSGLPPLDTDGESGKLTDQQLCAARLMLGLEVSRSDMEPGSAEEIALMSATGLQIPASAPQHAARWGLIDKTCQVMFVGESNQRVAYVFQTSTGKEGYETRGQNGVMVFKYNPAPGNNGWHDSFDYPSSDDNPLNGNMYKPLYIHRGQAIHGANTVPTNPASHGCARLKVENQQQLVDFVGLTGETQIVTDANRINFAVTVQGD